MLLININTNITSIFVACLVEPWIFFLSNQLFHPPLEGSERLSTDLDVSKHLNENVDQEWSQISQMHKRYFYSVLNAAVFCYACNSSIKLLQH